MNALAVISPFGDYEAGDIVADEDLIEEILAGENAHHVVPTATPDEE